MEGELDEVINALVSDEQAGLLAENYVNSTGTIGDAVGLITHHLEQAGIDEANSEARLHYRLCAGTDPLGDH